MRILVTYFSPFDGRKVNNSRFVAYELYSALSPRDVRLLELPVHAGSTTVLSRVLKYFDFVIALGEYDSDSAQIECRARDNESIITNQLCTAFTQLNIKSSYTSELRHIYICNLVNYYLITNYSNKSVFVHVPIDSSNNSEIVANLKALLERITRNIHRVCVVYATTESQQNKGFMDITEADPNLGIYFLFDSTKRHNMWMRNTHVKLNILFLDRKNKIISIKKGHPKSEKDVSEYSTNVLELPYDYVAVNMLKVGDEIKPIEC